jgi:GPH family glycoside/pentoside/hexuronide:cation symporter
VTRLPLGKLVAYAAPGAGFGFVTLLIGTYYMKYATDVLAIPAAAMGAILLALRAWDAIADPVAGYLSDRTRTRLGRRRPWLLAGALPLGAAFALPWSPPEALGEGARVAWVAGALLLLFTALTVCRMPHEALGAELSSDYHERNRVFGVKRALFGLGSLAVFAALSHLGAAVDPRAAALGVTVAGGAVVAALGLLAGLAVREPAAHTGRGAARPRAAARDVLVNPHARRLLAVALLQQVAMGTVTTAAAYHTEYVLGDARAFPALLGCFFVASLASIPVWLRVARRVEKKPLLSAAMAGTGLIMAALFAVGPGDRVLLFSLAAAGGFVGGALDVLMPSLQADVIDWDELRTGERKEGVYFAAWHLAEKLALGIAAAVTGAALAASGFVPNRPQGDTAILALRLLLSLFPLVCFTAGALCFVRFGLDRAAHAHVRRELDAARGYPRIEASTPAITRVGEAPWSVAS